MPGTPPKPVLPLPKQWNRRVRSAVVHAISLAQFVLTAARAQVSRHQRIRTRCSGPASFGGNGMAPWPFVLRHLLYSPAPIMSEFSSEVFMPGRSLCRADSICCRTTDSSGRI